MQGNEDKAFAFTFQAEGDGTPSLDPDDPGNWSSGSRGLGTLIGTKFGISAPVLISWYGIRGVTVTPQVMAELDLDTATAILGARYWNAMNCGLLPSGVDLSVNDHGFNAGDATSVKLLQRIVGVTEDGHCGWETVGAVQNFAGVSGASALDTLGEKLSYQALKVLQAALGTPFADIDGIWGPKTRAALPAVSAGAIILSCALFDAQRANYRSMAQWAKYGVGWTNRALARLQTALGLLTAD